MYEYEETIETIIYDYKQTYLNSDKLPENIFTKSLLTKNNDDENCYDVKSNFYISNLKNYIVNDEDIYISNVYSVLFFKSNIFTILSTISSCSFLYNSLLRRITIYLK